jgi:hypothetical protein
VGTAIKQIERLRPGVARNGWRPETHGDKSIAPAARDVLLFFWYTRLQSRFFFAFFLLYRYTRLQSRFFFAFFLLYRYTRLQSRSPAQVSLHVTIDKAHDPDPFRLR